MQTHLSFGIRKSLPFVSYELTTGLGDLYVLEITSLEPLADEDGVTVHGTFDQAVIVQVGPGFRLGRAQLAAESQASYVGQANLFRRMGFDPGLVLVVLLSVTFIGEVVVMLVSVGQRV